MKKLAFLGGVGGLGIAALLFATQGHAADHLDSPTLVANPMADINDVFTWMDAGKLNLAMSVSPVDDATRAFGPSVQYVFHVHSKNGLGAGVAGTGTETKVICTFASNTSAQCWVVDGSGTVKDYITGDPSSTAGITSASGKVKLFAGQRSDPFFFNFMGLRAAAAAVRAQAGTFIPDAAGCPASLLDSDVMAVRNLLSATLAGQAPCPTTPTKDCFAALNVRILLVQVDKSLVNAGANFAVGVWASTHQGS